MALGLASVADASIALLSLLREVFHSPLPKGPFGGSKIAAENYILSKQAEWEAKAKGKGKEEGEGRL